ncbi:mannose-6-phosphate isomerase, class I [Corynebacterium pelargi]|nr:mannose-6-phosphate isomerase, class I [Corynebacterium pelargi]
MRGEEASTKPLAELWYGAHPAAPATAEDIRLDQVIADDPEATLGATVAQRYERTLPFLLKLLAADQPLSLQAHPSLEQAREGFARENAQGIDIHAHERNYRDDNHKPELLVALSEFHAMAGFRPLDKTRELFAALECEELDHYALLISEEGEEENNLRALFTTWITIPSAARAELIDAVVTAAQQARDHVEPWMQLVLDHVIDLQQRHPGDIGVLGALLLNHLCLKPGEAIYLDAGNLHAYISGLGVEIMANSDNVLRGGLTPKYVDIPELVHVLRFDTLADPVVEPVDGRYKVPSEEFALRKLQIDGTYELEHAGPAIVLCTKGSVRAAEITLEPTEALWVDAQDAQVRLEGEAEVFIATVGAA